MSGSDFLLDEAGQITDQRYRIQKAVDDEVYRREKKGPRDVEAARISLRPYTKYEQQILDRIPARQRENNVQPQVVCGKKYEGEGYLSSPSQVEFIDFTVGETYKSTVTLTNVSRSFNAFKVLDIPKECRDILEVVYKPMSTMSAGMTATLTVVFTPKENIDIQTQINLLAKTGPFSIPIRCSHKRVVISTSTKMLDFGTTVIAEVVERTVTVNNDGALPCALTISGDVCDVLKESQVAESNKKTRRLLSLNLQKINNIRIEPFSSLSLTFSYSPLVPSDLDCSMYLSFDNATVDDVVVFLKGTAVDVPVFVSKNSVLDFQCGFYNTLMRDTFSVRNTTKSAVRVHPEVPAAMANSLEYVPKFGFVQPEAELEFQVKFTPHEELGAEVNRRVPITVAGQAMPIYFQLVASLTAPDVTFYPTQLSYGYCTVGEALSQKLRITNCCRLVRTMGFVKLPPAVKVYPSAVLTLAPGESTEVDVCVEATKPGPFSHQLTFRTDADELYHVGIQGDGKVAPLALSVTNITLPRCAFYDQRSAVSLLTNTSTTLQRFSFAVNSRYDIQVSPAHGELEKGQSIPITVTFSPHCSSAQSIALESDEEIKTAAEAREAEEHEVWIKEHPPPPVPKKRSKADEEADRLEKERVEESRRRRVMEIVQERQQRREELNSLVPWEAAREGEPFSRHRKIEIPCYIEGWQSKAIFLQISCSVVEPQFVAEALGSEGLTDSDGMLSLAFGAVPALQSSTRVFTVANRDEFSSTAVSIEALDPFGPFKVIKPPTSPLPPGHSCEIVVQFRPSTQAAFEEKLVVSSEFNRVCIKLFGEGLPATLVVAYDKQRLNNGEDDSQEVLHMGPCLVGDSADRVIHMANLSPFPLHVEMSFDPSQVSNFNPNGSLPFAVTPSRVTLPSKGKADVQIAFSPLLEAHFQGVLLLEFGGKGTTKQLRLEGNGWEKGLYVQFPLADEIAPIISPKPFSQFGDAPTSFGSQLHPVALSLSSCGGVAASLSIAIGNNKGSTNGDFAIEGLTDNDAKMGWKVENPKAVVAPAAKQTCTVCFAPTQLLLESLPVKNIGIVSMLSLRLTIKGGQPVQDTTYYLQVKGTAWQ